MDEVLKLLEDDQKEDVQAQDLKNIIFISKMIDVKQATIRDWARRGKIPSQKLFGSIRIPYKEFCKKFNIEVDIRYLSAGTISKRYSVIENCVRGWVYRGKIDGTKINGVLRISEIDLRENLKKK